jgi:hypothetical protein
VPSNTSSACSRPAARISSSSPAISKPAAAPGPPSPAACAPWPTFYKYAVEEELLDHSPAAHVRRPRLDYESHATGLDRNELGALLVAAGLGPPTEHALISLLALNGLRVSEATNANIEALGIERCLLPVLWPLPRTAGHYVNVVVAGKHAPRCGGPAGRRPA